MRNREHSSFLSSEERSSSSEREEQEELEIPISRPTVSASDGDRQSHSPGFFMLLPEHKHQNLKKTIKKIQKHLSLDEIGPESKGTLYVAKERGTPFVKVGCSSDVMRDARIEAITRKCEISLEKSFESNAVTSAHRAEQIVHGLLASYSHRRRQCPCGKKHREWYQKSFGSTITYVSLVHTWMSQTPYHPETGELKQEWCQALQVFEQSQLTRSPLMWAEFFLMGLDMQISPDMPKSVQALPIRSASVFTKLADTPSSTSATRIRSSLEGVGSTPPSPPPIPHTEGLPITHQIPNVYLGTQSNTLKESSSLGEHILSVRIESVQGLAVSDVKSRTTTPITATSADGPLSSFPDSQTDLAEQREIPEEEGVYDTCPEEMDGAGIKYPEIKRRYTSDTDYLPEVWAKIGIAEQQSNEQAFEYEDSSEICHIEGQPRSSNERSCPPEQSVEVGISEEQTKEKVSEQEELLKVACIEGEHCVSKGEIHLPEESIEADVPGELPNDKTSEYEEPAHDCRFLNSDWETTDDSEDSEAPLQEVEEPAEEYRDTTFSEQEELKAELEGLAHDTESFLRQERDVMYEYALNLLKQGSRPASRAQSDQRDNTGSIEEDSLTAEVSSLEDEQSTQDRLPASDGHLIQEASRSNDRLPNERRDVPGETSSADEPGPKEGTLEAASSTTCNAASATPLAPSLNLSVPKFGPAAGMEVPSASQVVRQPQEFLESAEKPSDDSNRHQNQTQEHALEHKDPGDPLPKDARAPYRDTTGHTWITPQEADASARWWESPNWSHTNRITDFLWTRDF